MTAALQKYADALAADRSIEPGLVEHCIGESGGIEQRDIAAGFAALLDDIYRLYNHDFRNYMQASLQRRLHWAMRKMQIPDIGAMREFIGRDADNFAAVLPFMTVPVSAMFRDPDYFLALRQQVVPMLKTYSSPKIWVAGCCTGEEAYSIAIVLREEGLLDRTVIYATDINPAALAQAQSGIFRLDRVSAYTRNYQMAGGRTAFSDYYHAAYERAVFDRSLRRHIVFAEHSLATDNAFSEVQFISCRNVMIYFQRHLQNRTLALFRDSLCHRGLLGLGPRESVEFSAAARHFDDYVKNQRIYRKAFGTTN